MKIIFLGTSGSMPSPERNSSCVAVKIGRSVVLLDCGEGTKRQMIKAHIDFNSVKQIFITHLHGDHVLGVPGLLQSMTLCKREEPLNVFGPKGIQAFLQGVLDTLESPNFPVTIHEICEPGVILEERSYKVEVCRGDHRLVSWSYAIIEKPRPARTRDVEVEGRDIRSLEVVEAPRIGKTVVYTGDTRPSDEITRLATGADLLIHESTFADDLIERANKDGHSTFSQAAEVAVRARVKQLILTHISSRYSDVAPLLEAAVKIFPHTMAAKDLLEVEV